MEMSDISSNRVLFDIANIVFFVIYTLCFTMHTRTSTSEKEAMIQNIRTRIVCSRMHITRVGACAVSAAMSSIECTLYTLYTFVYSITHTCVWWLVVIQFSEHTYTLHALARRAHNGECRSRTHATRFARRQRNTRATQRRRSAHHRIERV